MRRLEFLRSFYRRTMRWADKGDADLDLVMGRMNSDTVPRRRRQRAKEVPKYPGPIPIWLSIIR
jgi:hypothetical protein